MVLVVTLIVYLVVLLAIGLWARRRVGDSTDFHLAGRRLGPVVAALSASSSSSSVWTLLGVSGAAWLWGVQAMWLIPAVVSGFFINWFLVAPRLQAASRENGSVTLVEFLASGCGAREAALLRSIGAVLILSCFSLYVAAQFQGAGTAIAAALPGVSTTAAVVTGAVVVVAYVMLGGFWAASVTDALQGLMMLFVALVLPWFALAAVGGPGELAAGLRALGEPGLLRLVDQPDLMLAMVFIAGLFGIGLGYPGQPHVVNRFMALRSAEDIRLARTVALAWAAVIYIGMVVLGWSGRVLMPDIADHESVLLELSVSLLPALLGGLVTGGVLAAIMSTSDSQLLVAGGAVSHDLRRRRASVAEDRIVVLIVGAIALALALFVPATIFERVLFAWQVLGNGFGPLLLVLLWIGPVVDRYRTAAMLAGAGLTVVISFLPSAPGNAVERLVPFAVAATIAVAGAMRARRQR